MEMFGLKTGQNVNVYKIHGPKRYKLSNYFKASVKVARCEMIHLPTCL